MEFIYDSYNREERALCAHLFRLLHEQLSQKEFSPLGKFLNKLKQRDLQFENYNTGLSNLKYEHIGIFTEVAIIRDKYDILKNEKGNSVDDFVDRIVEIIKEYTGKNDCPLYSELGVRKSHPSKIGKFNKGAFSKSEDKVFGELQGIFNAKPDLAISIDNKLLTIEAKLTQKFDPVQLERTKRITEIWATMLYKDFGFNELPEYTVVRLGSEEKDPHISWNDILEIVQDTYPEEDRTRIAIAKGVELLRTKKVDHR